MSNFSFSGKSGSQVAEGRNDRDVTSKDFVVEDLIEFGKATLISGTSNEANLALATLLGYLISQGAPDFFGHPISFSKVLYLSNFFLADAEGCYLIEKLQDEQYRGHDNFSFKSINMSYSEEDIDSVLEELKAMGDNMPRVLIIGSLGMMYMNADALEEDPSFELRDYIDKFTSAGMAVICIYNPNDEDDLFDEVGPIVKRPYDSVMHVHHGNKVPGNYAETVRLCSLAGEDGVEKKIAEFLLVGTSLSGMDGNVATFPTLIPCGAPLTAERPCFIKAIASTRFPAI